jgi:CheY-like chemotaxis protein
MYPGSKGGVRPRTPLARDRVFSHAWRRFALDVSHTLSIGAMANILLVDDNEADRLLLKAFLETKGHALFFAENGEAALRIFGFHPIDVVVTDIQMPALNGLRLIRELREQDPDAAIVAVSGVAADQLPLAEDLGAIQGLAKPIDPEKLLTAVAKALDAREKNLWGKGKRP